MFKKTRIFKVKYKDHDYLDRFLERYHVEYQLRIDPNGSLVYTTRMSKNIFLAFCEHLNELRKLKVFPIML